MTAALDTVVRGLFDYAGMFPPAALGFDDMLAESARFGGLHRPFLVANDAVVTWENAQRISADALAMARYPRKTCDICVVGVGAGEAEAVMGDILAWNEAARAEQAPVHRRITTLEVGVSELSHDASAAVEAAAAEGYHEGVSLYAEPLLPDHEWRGRDEDVWAFMDDLQSTPVGLKVRGAGATALGPGTLSAIIPEVVRRGWAFKATQGLHHPMVEADRYGNALGFLTLALALRFGDRLDDQARLELLLESDASALRFDNGISWRHHRLSAQQVQDAAAATPFAVGSCSLSEPDADLVRLWPHRAPSILD